MATAQMAQIVKEHLRHLEKQRYIETASVDLSFLRKGIAVVIAESDADTKYCVEVVDGKAVSCGCDDYYWRSRRDPEHECKHMTATDKAIAKQAKPAKKAPRRSAVRSDVVASLQIAEGTKVRKVRGAGLVRQCKAVPTQCPVNAPQALAA